HYEPHAGRDATLRRGEVVLLDLWAGRSLDTVFADQTWMGFSGSRVPAKVQRIWETVRSARDAAVAAVQGAAAASRPIAGFEADRAARAVVEAAGFGDRFVHRTGHSIDRDLHGSGPHLDDYETHDDRRLVPGIGFSVEPGVYLTGEFGEHALGRGGPRGDAARAADAADRLGGLAAGPGDRTPSQTSRRTLLSRPSSPAPFRSHCVAAEFRRALRRIFFDASSPRATAARRAEGRLSFQ
ncbi:MAG: aminopeptidase P family protein, partial [Chloroflexi bacterium]